MILKNRLLTGVCAAGMVAAVAGTASAEAPNRADFKNAAKYCKALRTSSGSPEAFAEAVRAATGAKKVTVKNAYGKCVSKQARNEVKDDQEAKSDAVKQCKAERAQSDSDFAAAHDGKTFTQFYGTNKNGKNAYGNCVSSNKRAEEAQAAQENKDELSAAKECKDERAQDADAFRQQYGTNKNGKNAFGKCVSKTAREEAKERQVALKNASKECKAERETLGDEAFAAKYGTNKNGKNAHGKCVSAKAKAKNDSPYVAPTA